jgi:hypothetical protein
MSVYADPKPQPRPKRKPKGIQRKKRLNAVSKTRRRDGKDPHYLTFVYTLPCYMRDLAKSPCGGAMHAHHAIHKSQGGVDRDAIPLCRTHHDEWHRPDLPGLFFGMSKEGRRIWAEVAIEMTRAEWWAECGRAVGEKGR